MPIFNCLNLVLPIVAMPATLQEEQWRKYLQPANIRILEREIRFPRLFTAYNPTERQKSKQLVINNEPYDIAVWNSGAMHGGFSLFGQTKQGWNVISTWESGSGAYTVSQEALLLFKGGVLLQISSEQNSNHIQDISASGSIIVMCRHIGPPFGGESIEPTAINEKGYLFSNGKIYELPEFIEARFGSSGTITGKYEKVVNGMLERLTWKVSVSSLNVNPQRKIRRVQKYQTTWVDRAP